MLQSHIGDKELEQVLLSKSVIIFLKTPDIMRIFAEPFAYNLGSSRILEKSGFVYEGTLRKNAVKNGVVLDVKMYSRIRE